MYIYELGNIFRYGTVMCMETNHMSVVLAILPIINDPLLVLHCLYRPLLIEHIPSDVNG